MAIDVHSDFLKLWFFSRKHLVIVYLDLFIYLFIWYRTRLFFAKIKCVWTRVEKNVNFFLPNSMSAKQS